MAAMKLRGRILASMTLLLTGAGGLSAAPSPGADGLFDRYLRGGIPSASLPVPTGPAAADVLEVEDAQAADGVLRRVDGLLRQGDPATALKLVEAAVRRQPSVVALHGARAVVLDRLGRDGAARQAWRDLLELDAENPVGLVACALACIERGVELDQAERLLRRRLDRSPDDARAVDAVGWYWYKRGDLDRASAQFDRARALDPKLADPVFHAGLLALRRKDMARALTAFQEVIRLEPSHDRALISLGLLYEGLGERNKAVESLGRALVLVPAGGPVAKRLTESIRRQDPMWRPVDLPGMRPPSPGLPPEFLPAPEPARPRPRPTVRETAEQPVPRPAAAAPAPAAAPATAPAPAVRRLDLSLGEGETRKNHEKSATAGVSREAVVVSQGLLKRDLATTHLRLGKLYREHGLLRDAGGEFQTVINLAPLSAEAREAKGLLDGIVDFADPPEDEKVAVFLAVGEELFRQTDYENAAGQYKKILLLRPGSALAHKNLAYTYLRQGNESEAWAHLGEALSAAPDNAEALALKGYVLARRRNFREAEAAFATVASLVRPDSVLGRYSREMAEKMALFTDLR